MLRRSALKRFARVALAAMLFAQAALALAACESVRRAPAAAIALAEQQAADANCHEQPGNANLCLAHCLGEDQSLDRSLLKVPPLSGAPGFVVPAPPVSPHDARAPHHFGIPPAAAPPPRVLFQTFLI